MSKRLAITAALALGILAGATAQPASSKIVTVCGASNGTSYFFDGALIGSKKGWQNDGVAGGMVLHLTEHNGRTVPDLVYKDATSKLKSVLDFDAKVQLIKGKPGFTLLLLSYPEHGVAEHYTFHLDTEGNGLVVRGTIRVKGLVQKSTLMTAKCYAPDTAGAAQSWPND